MDFLNSYCQLGYYKFLIFKYRFFSYWKTIPSVYRYGCMICIGAGGFVCLYKYLNQPTHLDDSADFEETAALCKRREEGLPPGLYNEGNTCFLNCLLQAIATSPFVRIWIRDIDKEQSNSCTDLDVVCSLNRLLKVLCNEVGNEDDYSASGLVNSLRVHGWVISCEQHDAYELFQVLVSTVNEEIDHLLATYQFENTEKRFASTTSIVNRISSHLPSIRNIKSRDPFKGYFANKKTCLTCGVQSSVKFDAFGSIILNIPQPQVSSKFESTLDACFANWCKPEILNDVTCEKCPKSQDCDQPPKRKFSKATSLCKLPKCFCIEIQRTHYANDGSTRKDSTYVKFPEFLDVTPFRYRPTNVQRGRAKLSSRPLLLGGSSQTKEKKDYLGHTSSTTNWYKLLSVVLHFGDAYDGHFATYRRLPGRPDKWVLASDQEVTLVSKKVVFNSCAYMLFYEKML